MKTRMDLMEDAHRQVIAISKYLSKVEDQELQDLLVKLEGTIIAAQVTKH